MAGLEIAAKIANHRLCLIISRAPTIFLTGEVGVLFGRMQRWVVSIEYASAARADICACLACRSLDVAEVTEVLYLK